MKIIDVAQVAETKAKVGNPTMLEINDTKRLFEKEGGVDYMYAFFDLLTSLGVNIQHKYEIGLGHHVLIDGHDFFIDVKNASYLSRNVYKRTTFVRKPANRYVRLRTAGWPEKTIVKVPFNVELDGDDIKAKIRKAVSDAETKIENQNAQKNKDLDNLKAIGNHYFETPELKIAIKSFHIEKGIITFFLTNNLLSVQISGRADFVSMNMNVQTIISKSDIDPFLSSLPSVAEEGQKIIHKLLAVPPLRKELIEWTLTQYHRYFYTATMSPEPK